jgi:hypothetical protein
LLFSFLVCVAPLVAQCTIGYAYDAGGNRIARTASCPNGLMAPAAVVSADLNQTLPAIAETPSEVELDLTTVTVYPNPTVESFRLSFVGNLPEQGQLTLLDAGGRRLAQLPLGAEPYSLQAYPAGSYRVVLQTPTQRHLLSVVKSGH